jgi:23S rRNA (guanosine2251-2'-O)-methyltransferase
MPQGIGDKVELPSYVGIEEILHFAKSKPFPLIILLDGINDPENFGSILRTAEGLGVDGIIIKNAHQVELNDTVLKVSQGAAFLVRIAMVANLSNAIEILKRNGYWIISMDGEGKDNISQIDVKIPLGLVIGSEGDGVSNLIMKRSDFVVSLPMSGRINSFNASIALAIIASQIVYRR